MEFTDPAAETTGSNVPKLLIREKNNTFSTLGQIFSARFLRG